IGWYLGDGCATFTKNNPNRFTITIGDDNQGLYTKNIAECVKKVLNKNIVVEKKSRNTIIYFHSFSFKLLLQYFGLLNKKSYEKFIPSEFMNVKEEIQKSLLRGLLESDGYIVVGKRRDKAIFGHCTSSGRLASDIIAIYRQLGIFPSYGERRPKTHISKGKVFKSNYDRYDVIISTKEYLHNLRDIWKAHKNAYKLINFFNYEKQRRGIGKAITSLSKDFCLLEVNEVKKVKTDEKYVYDFSVPRNQNFVAGYGGMVLHNTDGSHIRTLLLTFFYRQMLQLVEKGHIYIALPPLYKIKRGTREEYIDTEEQMNDLLVELGTEGMEVKRLKDKYVLKDKKLRTLLSLLTELESLSHSIERRGVKFSKYLGFKHKKTKKLPPYRVKVEQEPIFLYNEDELAKLIKQEEKRMGKELVIKESGEKLTQEEVAKAIDVTEIYEARELDKIISKIDQIKIDVANYDPSKKSLLYRVKTGKETKNLSSLKELLNYVKTVSKQGMSIQRYKGLGEMNPEQLWETTMDPDKRVMLQVTVEDAVEAG
ncbi:MAG: hypothetical protein KAU58_06165, partial [Candidatus Omnitrophica bacterium]|nr:hypothetical protein [Candidatus Omnitrophota bacterium]